ncbi:MAG: hypothetical protein AAF762_13370 [Pseudomonadota bacterium]
MFRTLLALLALSLPAKADVIAFTDWVLRYDTAVVNDFVHEGPTVLDARYDRTGQTGFFEIYIQEVGLHANLPDGSFNVTRFSGGDLFYTEIMDSNASYGDTSLFLTFSGGDVVAWSGYSRGVGVGDGFYIDSTGRDTWVSFVGHLNTTTGPGSWSILSTSQFCFSDTQSDPQCGAVSAPPVAAVPVPPAIALLALPLLVLGGIGRRRNRAAS